MSRNERGSAVVEFALVVPLLVLLMAGIAEFGRAYHLQTTLSGAARQAVRVKALGSTDAATRTAARNVASSVTLTDAQIVITPSACAAGQNATVTISYSTPFLTRLFGATLNLTGEGVMRCGG